MALGYADPDTPSILAEEHVRNALAIQRINRLEANNNDTGICQDDDCGEEIPEARLKLIPNARFCVKCQARVDQTYSRLVTLTRGRPQGTGHH
jgi:phage/conjugal plasmid C-4 type zinc finger TraR family protein